MRGIGSVLLLGGAGAWLLRLGGPGLIVIGLVDNSVIPIPGGMDLFVILLSSHHREWWWYYGLMGTVGAVVGGYLTFRLSEKGGKEGMEKKFGKARAEKVYKKFEKGGFSTIAIGSVIPPPFPLVPVLMAAGIMQYPKKKVFGSPYARPWHSLFCHCGARKAIRHRDPGLARPLLQTLPLRPHRFGGAGGHRRVGVLQVVSPKAPAQLKKAIQSRLACLVWGRTPRPPCVAQRAP